MEVLALLQNLKMGNMKVRSTKNGRRKRAFSEGGKKRGQVNQGVRRLESEGGKVEDGEKEDTQKLKKAPDLVKKRVFRGTVLEEMLIGLVKGDQGMFYHSFCAGGGGGQKVYAQVPK